MERPLDSFTVYHFNTADFAYLAPVLDGKPLPGVFNPSIAFVKGSTVTIRGRAKGTTVRQVRFDYLNGVTRKGSVVEVRPVHPAQPVAVQKPQRYLNTYNHLAYHVEGNEVFASNLDGSEVAPSLFSTDDFAELIEDKVLTPLF